MQPTENQAATTLNKLAYKNLYAKGFSIFETENGYKLSVKKPWQNAANINFEYNLIFADSVPNQLLENEIHIPVKNVICLSTTHLGFLSSLGNESAITALSGTQYVYNEAIRKNIETNKTCEIGYDTNLDFEKIIEIKPDVVFAYGIGSEASGIAEKLAGYKIPVVFVGEYLETHPLAKTEWLLFFAAFFNQIQSSSIKFQQIEALYQVYKTELKNAVSPAPKVFFNLPYKEIWYMPGGKSYMAQFVNDAGGNYLWKNNNSEETLFYNMEIVLNDAHNAQIWLNTGSAQTINEIFEFDERMKHFEALKNNEIYNNNARLNNNGGNDFYESGVVNPHIVLKDLIQIFHPEIFPNDTFTYYKKLLPK